MTARVCGVCVVVVGSLRNRHALPSSGSAGVSEPISRARARVDIMLLLLGSLAVRDRRVC